MFELAAERDVPIFTHVRDMDIGAMQEVIANAAATGAPLHIVHVNSMSLGPAAQGPPADRRGAPAGLDVTTETYPYTAASTSIRSAIFDGDWRKKLGISYGDVQWQDTGERLTEKKFAAYRKKGGVVIVHMMQEEMIELAVKTPFVMIASDAMPYARGAHPRSAGTFARVLGRYVREGKTIDLVTALRKMTIMPAKRLEKVAPAMKKKGRLQVRADADVVAFDPAEVIDTATFDSGPSFSRGIPHVLVGGQLVAHRGEIVEGVLPGRAVLGRHARAGLRER